MGGGGAATVALDHVVDGIVEQKLLLWYQKNTMLYHFDGLLKDLVIDHSQ